MVGDFGLDVVTVCDSCAADGCVGLGELVAGTGDKGVVEITFGKGAGLVSVQDP